LINFAHTVIVRIIINLISLINQIDLSLFLHDTKNIHLNVLRLDQEDFLTGGNKLYKLKYNIQQAKHKSKHVIVTHGGAFSNHIAAVARQCKHEELQSVGIIRGEHLQPMNITLQRASDDGMKLIFVSREYYHQLRTTSERLQQALITPLLVENNVDISTINFVPEGGNNELGFKGSCEILNNESAEYDFICCAAGTGTTMAGIIASAQPHQTVLGIAAVRDFDFINNNVIRFLRNHAAHSPFKLVTDYTFGGFAKSNTELRNFVKSFSTLTSVAIEPVYTGKMFYGVIELIKKGYFHDGSRILCIHTGGMQYLEE
jgi:1-aminocyclopropane-1-carboxylate deaminase